MRAILINPETKTVEEVEFDFDLASGRTYRKINELIGASLFTVVELLHLDDGTSETLYVDDEGLLNDPKHFFKWKRYHQPLAGKGLILGTDAEGECIATTLELDFVKGEVEFPSIEFVRFEEIPEHTTTRYGQEFTVVGHTPIFKRKEQQ